MVYSFYDKVSSSYGYDDGSRLFNNPTPTMQNQNVGVNYINGLSSSPDDSFVFESEKAPAASSGSGKVVSNKNENNSEAKALAALKSHSEAERRRRERINGHLATLRGLVASNDQKIDKATLLGEVINRVKELKKNALEASKGFLIPMDADEVKVEPCDDVEVGNGSVSYTATICSDNRSEILSDLKHKLDSLQLQLVKAEMSTLEGRMKNVFIFTCCKNVDQNINVEACQALASTVRQALDSVLEKASSSLEFSLRTSHPSKRRRLCFTESSTSSCNHGSSCSC